jgi:hypothetical protein
LVVGRLWRRCAAAAREEGRQRPWAPPRPAPPPPHPQAGGKRGVGPSSYCSSSWSLCNDGGRPSCPWSVLRACSASLGISLNPSFLFSCGWDWGQVCGGGEREWPGQAGGVGERWSPRKAARTNFYECVAPRVVSLGMSSPQLRGCSLFCIPLKGGGGGGGGERRRFPRGGGRGGDASENAPRGRRGPAAGSIDARGGAL